MIFIALIFLQHMKWLDILISTVPEKSGALKKMIIVDKRGEDIICVYKK